MEQEQLEELLDEPVQFWRESIRFINKCTNPDKRGIGQSSFIFFRSFL